VRWAVVYNHPLAHRWSGTPLGIPLHPVQAYAALAYATLAVLLHRYTHRNPHLNSYAPRTKGPRISVIIPARNEAANIETCVRSILGTAYESIEVIVVDDRSSDGTAAIVEQVAVFPLLRPNHPSNEDLSLGTPVKSQGWGMNTGGTRSERRQADE
jgi:hypothetical protein